MRQQWLICHLCTQKWQSARPGGSLGGGGAPPQLGLHVVGFLLQTASNRCLDLKAKAAAQLSVSVQGTGQSTQISKRNFDVEHLVVEECGAGGGKSQQLLGTQSFTV